MFADDTKLFHLRNHPKKINNVNLEMNKLSGWFKANALSLNYGKTKYTLFHKSCQKDKISLKLTLLVINGKKNPPDDFKNIFGILLN